MGIGERQSPCLQSVLDPARALDEAAVGTRAEDAKPTSALVHEQPKAAIAGGPKYRAGKWISSPKAPCFSLLHAETVGVSLHTQLETLSLHGKLKMQPGMVGYPLTLALRRQRHTDL